MKNLSDIYTHVVFVINWYLPIADFSSFEIWVWCKELPFFYDTVWVWNAKLLVWEIREGGQDTCELWGWSMSTWTTFSIIICDSGNYNANETSIPWSAHKILYLGRNFQNSKQTNIPWSPDKIIYSGGNWEMSNKTVLYKKESHFL